MEPNDPEEQIEHTILKNLPQSFITFLKQRNISLQTFSITPPRYFRLKPSHKTTIQQLAKDIGVSPHHVTQIGDFYAIPESQNIHQAKLYSNGILYGMDLSSGWAVKALGLSDNLHVLELCCAPGNKLMYARDLMKGGSITGVDISIPRMEVTQSLINKYGHKNTVRLFCEDAITFNKLAEGQQLYDRVLVDAECTHQGSLKHLKKFINTQKKAQGIKKMSRKARKQFQKNNSNTYTSDIKVKNQWTKDDFQQRFLDKKKLQILNELQSGLLENGWKLLKPSGYLVYCTCSFDKSQNEEIVNKFIKDHQEAELVPAFTMQQTSAAPLKWEEGALKGTVRFTPVTSNTGGLFIAKIHKK